MARGEEGRARGVQGERAEEGEGGGRGCHKRVGEEERPRRRLGQAAMGARAFVVSSTTAPASRDGTSLCASCAENESVWREARAEGKWRVGGEGGDGRS